MQEFTKKINLHKKIKYVIFVFYFSFEIPEVALKGYNILSRDRGADDDQELRGVLALIYLVLKCLSYIIPIYIA